MRNIFTLRKILTSWNKSTHNRHQSDETCPTHKVVLQLNWKSRKLKRRLRTRSTMLFKNDSQPKLNHTSTLYTGPINLDTPHLEKENPKPSIWLKTGPNFIWLYTRRIQYKFNLLVQCWLHKLAYKLSAPIFVMASTFVLQLSGRECRHN